MHLPSYSQKRHNTIDAKSERPESPDLQSLGGSHQVSQVSRDSPHNMTAKNIVMKIKSAVIAFCWQSDGFQICSQDLWWWSCTSAGLTLRSRNSGLCGLISTQSLSQTLNNLQSKLKKHQTRTRCSQYEIVWACKGYRGTDVLGTPSHSSWYADRFGSFQIFDVNMCAFQIFDVNMCSFPLQFLPLAGWHARQSDGSRPNGSGKSSRYLTIYHCKCECFWESDRAMSGSSCE